jgi:hypothetical protein
VFRSLIGGCKNRNVTPGWNHNPKWVIRALGLIVFAELLAKPVHLDAGNSILAGIEALGPAEDVNGDVVFLYLVRFALEVFGAKVLQQPR